MYQNRNVSNAVTRIMLLLIQLIEPINLLATLFVIIDVSLSLTGYVHTIGTPIATTFLATTPELAIVLTIALALHYRALSQAGKVKLYTLLSALFGVLTLVTFSSLIFTLAPTIVHILLFSRCIAAILYSTLIRVESVLATNTIDRYTPPLDAVDTIVQTVQTVDTNQHETKSTAIKRMLQTQPDLTVKQIAGVVQCSDNLVFKVRRNSQSIHLLPDVVNQ